jgi:hypothetical protein
MRHLNLEPLPMLAPPGYVQELLDRRADPASTPLPESDRIEEPAWLRDEPLIQRNRLRAAVNRGEQLVYFIQAIDGGPIKIGTAKDPSARLLSLQTGSHHTLVIRKVIPGGAGREAELHSRFRDQRVRGEWFTPSRTLCRLSGGIDV